MSRPSTFPLSVSSPSRCALTGDAADSTSTGHQLGKSNTDDGGDDDPILTRITSLKVSHRTHGRWCQSVEWSRHRFAASFGQFVKESFRTLAPKTVPTQGEPTIPTVEEMKKHLVYEADESFRKRMASSESSSSVAFSVPRLDGATLTPETFQTLIEAKQIPCIIANLADEWKMATWSIEGMSSKDNPYADVKFKVDEQTRGDPVEEEDGGAANQDEGSSTSKDAEDDDDIDAIQADSFKLTLHEFMHYLHHNRDDVPLYVFDAVFDCHPVGRLILDEYTVPPHFGRDLLSYLGEVRRPPYRWLLIGPERSGSSVHTDPLSTSAWNTCIDGVKRWVLFPPHVDRAMVKGRHLVSPSYLDGTGSSTLSDEDVADAMEAAHYFTYSLPLLRGDASLGMVEFLQFPGETVFVPHGWLHAVINLTATVAITQNYVSPRNFESSWVDARVQRPHLAQRWIEQLDLHQPDLSAIACRLDTLPPLDAIPPLKLASDRRPIVDVEEACQQPESWYFNPSSDEEDDDDDEQDQSYK